MKKRDKMTAAKVALIFGGLGGHKFYLGRWFLGFLYLIFFFTLIPIILGMFEGMAYAAMSEEEFQRKYVIRRGFTSRKLSEIFGKLFSKK